MRVMVIVKASKSSEAGVMPSERLFVEMGNFNEELASAGIMLAGEGLRPSSEGARVRFSGKKRTVMDGPFAETKDLVAGFWLWRVNSMAEAIEWVKRCPNPHEEDCEIEIRPVFEAADFGEAFTPELREQEAAIRAQSQGLAARFEDGPGRTIAGFNERYTFESRVKIPAQWTRFAPHIGNVPGQVNGVAYGVCWNYEPGSGFDYLSGVEVAAADGLPADFAHVRLEDHRYAVFRHDGHVSALPATIETIWTKWVPDCGLEMAHAPCFERYTEQFDPQSGKGGIEVWIPLKS